MIDRELLAQVMKSHIDQEMVDQDASNALAANEDVRDLAAGYVAIAMETSELERCFGAALSIGFNLGREYESLAGREYRSKLTEPFGGL